VHSDKDSTKKCLRKREDSRSLAQDRGSCMDSGTWTSKDSGAPMAEMFMESLVDRRNIVSINTEVGKGRKASGTRVAHMKLREGKGVQQSSCDLTSAQRFGSAQVGGIEMVGCGMACG
jgi:hypothetical protein